MAWKFFNDPRVQDGLDQEQYLAVMTQQADADPTGLDEEAAHRLEFTKLNLHRTGRIDRTYKMSGELASLIAGINEPQLWVVLTEPWCGDSAQCLPQIAIMARANPLITLRLVLRDENLDIMDELLTDGKRAIPRLIALDQAGEVIFQWGPRPAAAQVVFDQAKAEGLEKPDLLERLHLFYGRDRSKALEQEFIALLTDANTS